MHWSEDKNIIQRAEELLRDHSWEATAIKLSSEFSNDQITRENLRSAYRYKKRIKLPQNRKVTINALDVLREMDNDRRDEIDAKLGDKDGVVRGSAHSINELIEKADIDLELWEVYEARIKDSEWGVTLKIEEGEWGNKERSWKTSRAERHKNQQFSIEIKVRRKADIFDWHKFKAEFIKDIKTHSPKVKEYKYKPIKDDPHCLEIDIFDLHFGKLGWHEETSTMSYDSKIATKRFMRGMQGLVKKAQGFPIDRILFPVGNDFFNSDNAYPYPTTTRGTPQQDDLRWQKVFREGRKLLMDGIDYLATVAPVDVIIVPGNHDFQRSFYLGDVLDVGYANNPNVNIDNRPNPRKYWQYGRNLIGLTHGNRKNENLMRLITLMPQEVPQLWVKTKFREWHLGDIHHKKVWKLKSEEDFQGINIRYMRTLTGDDAWHNQKGFKGAIRGCEGYIWSKRWGLSANINYNIII